MNMIIARHVTSENSWNREVCREGILAAGSIIRTNKFLIKKGCDPAAILNSFSQIPSPIAFELLLVGLSATDVATYDVAKDSGRCSEEETITERAHKTP
jgi:hypothetical protein